MQNQPRTPTIQPLTVRMESTPTEKVTPGAALSSVHVIAQAIQNAHDERMTREELEAARTAPDNSPQTTLAEARRRFLREQTGPSIVPFECVGETLFAKRFNFGEILYLTLLASLDEFGFLDATQPEKLAFMISETLRLGLCRDAHATPYFENRGDAVAFIDDDATAIFASIAVMNVDALNNLFPKRAETPAEAPKTRSQKRLEKMHAKAEQAPAETPETASETPSPTQDTQPETTQ